MQPKGQENRGGARPNSGPKKKQPHWSDQFKKGIVTALKKKAKETGKTVHDVFVEILYDPKQQGAVRASLFKTLSEIMVVRESKQTVEKWEHKRPTLIGLAEIGEPEQEDASSAIH